QREVSREHGRAPLVVRVLRAGDDGLGVLGDPLPGARRALRELPLVVEQVLEEAVRPAVRGSGPGHLETAGDRIGALAAVVAALPTETLRLERSRLRFRADEVGRSGAVGLAEA